MPDFLGGPPIPEQDASQWPLVAWLAVGYLFSFLIGHWCTRLVVVELHRRFGTAVPGFLPAIVAYLERALYTTAWLLGTPQFIAVWLALKVAGQWKRFTRDESGLASRSFYNAFLVGNGLNISFGVVGGLIVQWLINGNVTGAILAPIALIGLTLALYLFTRVTRFV